MQRGDIYLAAFPFGDRPGMKLRPVLLLTSSVGVAQKSLSPISPLWFHRACL